MASSLLRLFMTVTILSVAYSWVFRSSHRKLSASKRQGYHDACSYEEYSCSDGSGCAKYCNGVSDCMDGEDEKWCGCKDPMDTHCSDGVSCYNSGQYCDGNKDCPDGSDESFCGCPNPSDYHCNDGVECYNPAQYCDSVQQCSDGSDEMWCPCTDPKKDYSCMDGTSCAGYCDGNSECKDGDDEMNCHMNVGYTTSSYSWTTSWNNNNDVGSFCGYGSVKECINGNCVDVNDICNGYDSCSSLENEWFCKDYHNNYYYIKKKVQTRRIKETADDKVLRVKAYDLTRSRHNTNSLKQRMHQRTSQRKGQPQQKKTDNLQHLLTVLKQKLATRKLHKK